MSLRYETPLGTWSHSFSFEPLDRTTIEIALAAADLRFERFLDPQQTWIVATAA